MAKVTGPLLSIGAAGQVAKTQVYATWKGRQYVRRHVVPANPNSDSQKLTRGVFAYNFGLYRFGTTGMLAALAASAKASLLTPANMMNKSNLHEMVLNINNQALMLSPGAGGAPATLLPVITPGVGTLSVAVPAPILPTGWTDVPKMYACAVKEWHGADYSDVGTDHTIVEANQAVPAAGTYTVALAGLTSAALYVVCAFYSVLRPDKTTAWGTSVALTATPT